MKTYIVEVSYCSDVEVEAEDEEEAIETAEEMYEDGTVTPTLKFKILE